MTMSMTGVTGTVAIIPARGGSKGVPGKNLKEVGGVSLVGRAIQAAAQVDGIDLVAVSTDDAAIAAEARSHGATVVDRPAELAGDQATSESALVHAIETLRAQGADPQRIAFLQATSPFIDVPALGRAVAVVAEGRADSAFSAVETYAFLWRRTEDGAEGVNHDKSYRPRRQDREPHYQETGAFYVMDLEGFLAANHRFFGRVEVIEVDPSTAIEIDDLHELELARRLAESEAGSTPIPAKAVVTDFDGVHTDDTATVTQDGVESVTVSRSDGMGVARLRAAGVPFLILSKERNPVVSARAEKLRVDVRQGIDDKPTALAAWCAEVGVDLADVVYMGNDINDVESMRLVGWPTAPADARPEAIAVARVTCAKPGGRGAVREIAERVLAAWEDDAS
ncbi:acylneuraminate cytidylyltransferase [Demequina sp. NBRC 110054]|uniref:acylneuraminate cytidylyltransferase n=1 Tax=Demequina sp. NBRC 110054 TaxID=1570343 RepID=UPI001F40B88B|nr:acylneuraminate cytidylyltransferase [Demequina sp. NBRC 110054]